MIHRPHQESWDVEARINHDRYGGVQQVDDCRLTDFGLYVLRPIDHSRVIAMESWLLPSLGLRVTDFWLRPEFEPQEDFYVDIADIAVDGSIWRTVDYYLDILVRTGREAEVVDSDEFVAAVAAGLLDLDVARRALDTCCRTVTGIAAHGYDLDGWLRTHGIALTWQRIPTREG
ncbi:MAG TPA: DUF402 domain-containing protein [Actinopolymorphaceae bacterium]|nr:DUF402 domain-containing protein [Actinopolymorphaceae bacterium]